MFSLTEGAGVRLCDGLTHREALRIGRPHKLVKGEPIRAIV